MNENIFDKLGKGIIEGDKEKTLELVKRAIEDKISVEDILTKGLIPGIKRVGELFDKGEYFLPELIVSGMAMQSIVEYINPMFKKKEGSISKKFLIGSVKGDIHDIGKNIVVMMLRSDGWEVTDLGVDVSSNEFCNHLKTGNYDVIGMSVLLTMTINDAEGTIKSFVDAGIRNKVKVIIGGAPITQEIADNIGADAYGKNAWDAVSKSNDLLKMNRQV